MAAGDEPAQADASAAASGSAASGCSALKLRAMADGEIDLAEVVARGGAVDPDLLYRALPYLVTRSGPGGTSSSSSGHRDRRAVRGDIEIRDGQPIRVLGA